METYRVMVEGRNLCILLDEKLTRIGFYTTLIVSAENKENLKLEVARALAEKIERSELEVMDMRWLHIYLESVTVDDFEEADMSTGGFSLYRITKIVWIKYELIFFLRNIASRIGILSCIAAPLTIRR